MGLKRIDAEILIDNKIYAIPAGYIMVKSPDQLEIDRISQEIIDTQTVLESMSEPTNEELINYGELFHPYYEALRALNAWPMPTEEELIDYAKASHQYYQMQKSLQSLQDRLTELGG